MGVAQHGCTDIDAMYLCLREGIGIGVQRMANRTADFEDLFRLEIRVGVLEELRCVLAHALAEGAAPTHAIDEHTAVIQRAGIHVVRCQLGLKVAGHDVDIDLLDVTRHRQGRVEAQGAARLLSRGRFGFIDQLWQLALDAVAHLVPQHFLCRAVDRAEGLVEGVGVKQGLYFPAALRCPALSALEVAAQLLLIGRAAALPQRAHHLLAHGQQKGLTRFLVMVRKRQHGVGNLEFHGILLSNRRRTRRALPLPIPLVPAVYF